MSRSGAFPLSHTTVPPVRLSSATAAGVRSTSADGTESAGAGTLSARSSSAGPDPLHRLRSLVASGRGVATRMGEQEPRVAGERGSHGAWVFLTAGQLARFAGGEISEPKPAQPAIGALA